MACRRRCTTAPRSTTRRRAGLSNRAGKKGVRTLFPKKGPDPFFREGSMPSPIAADGKPSAELQQLVADADLGGRAAGGLAGKFIFAVAVAWSLFQLWYASPFPFEFGWAILNDTEARSLHLGVGMLLAFLCFPMLQSQRRRIPVYDWVLAAAGAFAGGYFLLFY